MSLQITTHLNVDFYDKKYILINAKQYDKSSRFLSITCYNHGEIFHINSGEHSAYIRYKKPDNNSVFNFCNINNKGKIIVELTEQMLAIDGICYVDLVIVNKGSASIDTNTGEIVTIDDAGILSTMVFCIDVSETSVENSEIESSYEYNGLNEALEKAEAEYTEVIMLSKSYAVGDAGGIRKNENTDNSKYYYEQSLINANNSATSASKAATSATNAETYMHSALASSQNAETYMNNAKIYMNNASTSATNAADSAASAYNSESTAKTYATTAKNSMTSASNSASAASDSATNAYNYYLQAEAITNGLNGAFLPMGTIEYEELASLKENNIVAAGYLYNISNNFTTDETFRIGAGVEYNAGANVYFTADGSWDVLAGATVTGIKGENETIYRKGNVNLTANHIGAISTADIATVDEVMNYLSI